MPTASEFRAELKRQLQEADASFIDVNASDLHREVGGYPGASPRMPNCCQVMLSEMRPGDQILRSPPNAKHHGAVLTIRYLLPRPA